QYEVRSGRWVAEPSWPSPRIQSLALSLKAGGLLVRSGAQERRLEIHSPPATGMASGDWCAFGRGSEMPIDQRRDDGGSMLFDSEPLTEPLEILGMPRL